MATRVVGLDIGASSVKAVVIDVSGRTWQLIEVLEEPIHRAELAEGMDPMLPPIHERPTPANGSPTLPLSVPPIPGNASTSAVEPGEASAAAELSNSDDLVDGEVLDEMGAFGAPTLNALRRMAGQGVFEGDRHIYACLPANSAYVAVVTLPFSDPKQVELVLPPQLEGKLPVESEDLLVDFMVSGTAPNGEHRIFAAGVDPTRLALSLAELEDIGAEPRVLDLPPWSLLAASRGLAGETDDVIGVVDIGATSTQLLVHAGANVLYTRSFNIGGDRVTRGLADVFELGFAKAQDGKHSEGFIDAAMSEPAGSVGDDAVDIAQACREAVKPLVRQLRRSLHAQAAESGTPVGHVYLCGGGSALPGLPEYLAQSLGVEVSVMPIQTTGAQSLDGFSEVANRFTNAMGLALRAAGVSASGFNLRRGDFAYRGSFDYVLQRVPQIIFGVAVLALAAFALMFARTSSLEAERDALDNALGNMTEQVFLERTSDPEVVSSRLMRAQQKLPFLPEASATLLLAEIVGAAVETQNLGYDATTTAVEVDLERNLFRVDGLSDSAESVDEYQRLLATVGCLEDLERNELQQVTGGDGFEFAISGEVNCNPGREDDE
ncbi:MAG: general secretion pathway protein L [Bradymonadia bacterium]